MVASSGRHSFVNEWPPRGQPPCAHSGRDNPEAAVFAYLGYCPPVLDDDLEIDVIVRGEKSGREHCFRVDRDPAAAETHRWDSVTERVPRSKLHPGKTRSAWAVASKTTKAALAAECRIGRRGVVVKLVYRIVRHDGGWAYQAEKVYSETFASHDAARSAAERVAREQRLPGDDAAISFEDSDGHWHEEFVHGKDRPETTVEG